MYKLTIEKAAQDDIKELIAKGGQARISATRILTFLQELKGDQRFLSELLTRYFENDNFHVDKFVTCHDDGLNIWRVKVFEFDFNSQKKWSLPYRVIYGYDQEDLTFRVLGILPRNFNYEPDHELTKRIRRTYDELGLPHFRVASARTSRK